MILILRACGYHTTSPGHTPGGIRIHDTSLLGACGYYILPHLVKLLVQSVVYIHCNHLFGYSYLLTLLMVSISMALLLVACCTLLFVLPVHLGLVHHVTLNKTRQGARCRHQENLQNAQRCGQSVQDICA